MNHPKPSSPALVIGSGFHTATLEPEKLDDEFAVKPSEIDGQGPRTKHYKESFELMQKSEPDKQWLAPADYDLILEMAGSALENPVLRHYMADIELAMMCDFIIAADNAKFGQPEINLGVIAGMGGSQRMTRYIGKSKSMDMNLTGRLMEADEAERCGLVSRVVPTKKLIDEAMGAAAKIAEKSMMAVMAAKEAVNRSYETTLDEGLLFERRLFHSLFATEDQKEGMAAFIEKREAQFRDK